MYYNMYYNNIMYGHNNNAKDYKHQKIYKGDVICVKRDIMKKQKLQTKKEYNNETKAMFEHIYCI
ncbi:hypothetical protein AGMMS49593_02950 [Endomicrobiia bacterium]|nr:hypothetical protein AGMMS49593_02950 [Endomicrobiia bacterium]